MGNENGLNYIRIHYNQAKDQLECKIYDLECNWQSTKLFIAMLYPFGYGINNTTEQCHNGLGDVSNDVKW